MRWLILALLALFAGIALASVLLIVAYSAEINSAGMEVPTQEQILACKQDAHRLCPTFVLGPYDQLSVCMQAHKLQLSRQCKDAFK
jgi:hypothetical protein